MYARIIGSIVIVLTGCGRGGNGNSSPDADTISGSIDLAASPVSSSQIRLAWSAGPGDIKQYRVYRCHVADCTPTDELAQVSGTSYQDGTLTARTSYRYQVVGYDAAGSVTARSATTAATTLAGTSELAMLAASMAAGSWAMLPSNNIDATLLDDGADGNALGYTDGITFDPVTETFLYLGGDHAALSIFATYDAGTNAWSQNPRAPWMPMPTDFLRGMMHAYHHSAIDPAGRHFYHRFGSYLHSYNIDTQTWDSPMPAIRPTAPPFGDYINCCDALEYFPELGGVVWASGDESAPGAGHVYLYNDAMDQWSVLSSNVDLSGTWHTASYNPVYKVVIFFSAQTNKLYKLDSSGQITQISSPPFTVYDGSGYVGVLTVDPVSGKYVALSATSRDLYTYDVPTDTWQAQASTNMPDLASKPIVATPVAVYGVIFYTACRVANGCQIYLYKYGG
jgi:fibronectin type III domain protein